MPMMTKTSFPLLLFKQTVLQTKNQTTYHHMSSVSMFDTVSADTADTVSPADSAKFGPFASMKEQLIYFQQCTLP